MKILNRVLAVFVMTLASFSMFGSCSSANLCASQQTQGGAQLYEWLLPINPSHVPRPLGYNSTPLEEAVRVLLAAPGGICGQLVCANSEAEARAAFAAAIGDHNPSDPSLWVGYVGLTIGDAASNYATNVAAWIASGSHCYDGEEPTKADAGAECAKLGEACDSRAVFAPNCCPTQAVVPGQPVSTLECEPTDIDVNDMIGTCRVDVWNSCLSDDQCFQSVTPDDQPLACQGGVCCAPEGRGCWGPDLGGDYPLEGCCQGLTCTFDAIDGLGTWDCE